jgi:hypothetical protein
MLGVATVVPDTSSGGIAFLARLPLGHARALATKVGVAAALATVVFLLQLGLALLATPSSFRREFPPEGAAAVAAFAFAAGVLASVVAQKTMPAVLVAPMILVGTLVVGAGYPTLVHRINWQYVPLGTFLGGFGFLASTLGAGGVVAYLRGERHRPSYRPGVVALVAIAPLLVAGAGAFSAAHAWSVAHAPSELPALRAHVSPDGRTIAVLTGEVRWTGFETRVVLVTRPSGDAWVLPIRCASDARFSPDGRRCLVREGVDDRTYLVDLDTREVSLPIMGRDDHGALQAYSVKNVDGETTTTEWSWRGSDALPRWLVERPHDDWVVDPTATRALVRDDRTYSIVTLADGASRPLDASPSLLEALASQGEIPYRTWWSPGGTKLLLELPDRRIAAFDGETGRCLDAVAIEPVHGVWPTWTPREPAWSPDETFVVLQDGTHLPLAPSVARVAGKLSALAFVTPSLYVELGKPFHLAPLR